MTKRARVIIRVSVTGIPNKWTKKKIHSLVVEELFALCPDFTVYREDHPITVTPLQIMVHYDKAPTSTKNS